MPRAAAEGWEPLTPIETAAFKRLTQLHEAVTKAGGTAGVLGVAIASPFAFRRLPWLVAVLAVFLAGLLVELGPGLLLEALHRRAEAAAKKKRKREEEEEDEEPLASTEEAAATAAFVRASSSSPSSSVRQRRARPSRLGNGEREDEEEEEEEQSPTAAGGRASSGAGAGRRRRDESLQWARVDVQGWRVVEGKFASYKVVVKCKEGGSWTVWRRSVQMLWRMV